MRYFVLVSFMLFFPFQLSYSADSEESPVIISTESDSPTDDSTGESDSPTDDSTGESDSPTDDSIGESDSPTDDSIGESDSPSDDSIGESDSPTDDSTGESDSPADDSTGESDSTTDDNSLIPSLETMTGIDKNGIEVPASSDIKLRGGISIDNGTSFNKSFTASSQEEIDVSGLIEVEATSEASLNVFVIGFAVPKANVVDGEDYANTCDGSAKGQYYMLNTTPSNTTTSNGDWYQAVGTRPTKTSMKPYFEKWDGKIENLTPYLTEQVLSPLTPLEIVIMQKVKFLYAGRLCLTVAYQLDQDDNFYFSPDTINLTISE
jgi:hypothetical protein